MLNEKQAAAIIAKKIPKGTIQNVIDYRGLFIFQVFIEDPFEEDMDPFYSVNKQTGEFKEFSIITDGDITEVTALFMAAKTIEDTG